MIRIVRENPTCVTLKGHAGSDVYGRDLVCAGVSALALTLGENLREVTGAEVVLLPGNSRIRCPREESTLAVFDCVCRGFSLLARKYPDNVRYLEDRR